MAGPYRYQHGDKPLEGYTVLRGIGRGGFGEVYYAVSDGGREVALKVIQQNHDIELRGVKQCINLKSPHLVSIFDVRKNADGAPFVIMEYVAGPSLRELIPKGGQGLGADKAAYLIREIAKGLSYLHDRGIVHRDLKPENIFFEDGYAKIGDYGLSKYISVSRQSGQTISVGTVHYMAPEIGSGNYHQGIDIYALGIIFYELLTGNVPFNGDSMGEILMKHLTCEPDVSVLEGRFQPIVRKALAKNPLERYRAAREMVDDIFSDDVLAALVAHVDPQSLIASRRDAESAPTAAVGGARNDTAGPAAVTGNEGDAVRPPPAPQTPQPPPSRRWPLEPRVWERRLVPGIATAAALAMGIGLLERGPHNVGPMSVVSYFSFIAAAAAAILWVESWAVPRFQIASDVVRRLVTLGFVGPLVILLVSLFSSGPFDAFKNQRCLLALLCGLACVDWGARVNPSRREQVSVGGAVSAGLFGLIASLVTSAEPLEGGGLLAAMSLVLNALSPYVPPLPRQRASEGAPGPAQRSANDPSRMHIALAPPGAPTVAMPPPLPALPVTSRPTSLPLAAPPRLYRSRTDRVFAGVSGGLAAYNGWDPLLTRLSVFFLILFTLPVGLLIYIGFGFAVPKEPRGQTIPRYLSGPVMAPAERRGPRRIALFIRYLVPTALVIGGSWYLVLFVSHRSGPEDATMAFFTLILGVGLSIGFLAGEKVPQGTNGGARGWHALGILLVALGIVLGAGREVAFTGLADDILRELPGSMEEKLDFFRSKASILIPFGIFLAGATCCVVGRRALGWAHVVRGIAGWGAFLALPILGLMMIWRTAAAWGGGRIHVDEFPAGQLAALVLTGCVGTVLLAWRSRAARLPVAGPLPTGQEMAA